MSFWKSFFRKTLLYLMTNRSHIISDYSGPPRWINSISSWDTSFLLYFWGRVLIISAVSGGPWCISQSGDLLPLECCEIEEVWDGSPADRRTSDTFGLGLSLLSGNLINGVCGLTTWTTLLADAILLPIMTPEKGQLPGRWRAAVLTGVPRGSGRARPVASRRRSGRGGRTLLHCGASPTPWCLTPPRLSSRWGADPRVSRCFRFAGEDLWCWIYFVHQPMSDLGPFLLRIVSF